MIIAILLVIVAILLFGSSAVVGTVGAVLGLIVLVIGLAMLSSAGVPMWVIPVVAIGVCLIGWVVVALVFDEE